MKSNLNTEKPKALLFLIPGLGDWCDYYKCVAYYLCMQGYEIAGMDPSGFGDSEGKFNHIESLQNLAD